MHNKINKTENCNKCPIYSPQTPDQPPFKGGRYCNCRSEGFSRTGYFVPACVGSGRWADFESCSRIRACGFRCFCRNDSAFMHKTTTCLWKSSSFMHGSAILYGTVAFLCIQMLLMFMHTNAIFFTESSVWLKGLYF